jgi:hypothetical protein
MVHRRLQLLQRLRFHRLEPVGDGEGGEYKTEKVENIRRRRMWDLAA